MSQPFPGFTGPSYTLDNIYAAIERSVNWYPVPNEGQGETKYQATLAPSPGNAPFSQLPVPAPFNYPNRQLVQLNGEAFGVNGPTVFHLSENGVYTQIGTVVDDGKPCCMIPTGTQQIFIASAGYGYVIPSAGPPLISLGNGTDPSQPFLGASYATFQDNYVLVVTPNSKQFQISGTDVTPVGDARLWNAGNVSIQEGQADQLRAIISSREYLRLLGARRSQIYANVGSGGIGGFPFQSYNETFIETGIGAVFSLVDLGDSLIWIGEDERGQRACWLDRGFQPQRVSNFAVEQFWQSYSTIADCVAFPYIWKGHLMIQFKFPTAGATWVYDKTASEVVGKSWWHERQYSTYAGRLIARPESFHTFCYGVHLVGSDGTDGNPGAVYQYADSYDDAGADQNGNQITTAMVCDRICPHLWQGYKRIIYNRIEFEFARGVGAQAGPPQNVNPKMLLCWKDTSGGAWSAEHQMSMGLAGQYGIRAYINRCGYGRDRVFWLRCAGGVYNGLVAAMLDMQVLGS